MPLSPIPRAYLDKNELACLYTRVSSFENGVRTRSPHGLRKRSDLLPPHVRQQLLDGAVLALVRCGYEDAKVADIVDLAAVSPPTFYDHFESKEDCYEAALRDGLTRLSSAVEEAVAGARRWVPRLSAGLRAGLEFLAAEPALAHLLLVESPLPLRPFWREHERILARLAEAIRPSPGDPGRGAISEETARLLAGGIASHLSGRVLAGEAERLSESFDLLFVYLLTPSFPATPHAADERLT